MSEKIPCYVYPFRRRVFKTRFIHMAIKFGTIFFLLSNFSFGVFSQYEKRIYPVVYETKRQAKIAIPSESRESVIRPLQTVEPLERHMLMKR